MHQRPYEKLIAWKEAYALCLTVYRKTADFPSYERFGITSQMRRASSSVPLNLAEGNSKRTHPDKIRFIDMALASLEELHCEVKLSVDLGYLDERSATSLYKRIHRTSYLLTRLRAAFSD